MTRNDVYMHGQILGTHSFWLRDGFLKPDDKLVRFSNPLENSGLAN